MLIVFGFLVQVAVMAKKAPSFEAWRQGIVDQINSVLVTSKHGMSSRQLQSTSFFFFFWLLICATGRISLVFRRRLH